MKKILIIIIPILFIQTISFCNIKKPFIYKPIIKKTKGINCTKTACKTVSQTFTPNYQSNVEVTATATCCSTVTVSYTSGSATTACESAQEMATTNATFCASAQLNAMVIPNIQH